MPLGRGYGQLLGKSTNVQWKGLVKLDIRTVEDKVTKDEDKLRLPGQIQLLVPKSEAGKYEEEQFFYFDLIAAPAPVVEAPVPKQ